MEQLDWAARIGRTVAVEVRRLRQERGLSAQQLSDACADLGMVIPRTVLSNLENGRRENVTVTEVIIIAAALKVPPATLIYPVGMVEEVEALPGKSAHPLHAVQWFAGEVPELFSNAGGMSEYMRAPIFWVRQIQKGREKLQEKHKRFSDLHRLIEGAPSDSLKDAYREALAEEIRLEKEGSLTVSDWVKFISKDHPENPSIPLIPYPDSTPPVGRISVEMVAERPPGVNPSGVAPGNEPDYFLLESDDILDAIGDLAIKYNAEDRSKEDHPRKDEGRSAEFLAGPFLGHVK